MWRLWRETPLHTNPKHGGSGSKILNFTRWDGASTTFPQLADGTHACTNSANSKPDIKISRNLVARLFPLSRTWRETWMNPSSSRKFFYLLFTWTTTRPCASMNFKSQGLLWNVSVLMMYAVFAHALTNWCVFLSDGRRLHLQSYHSECFPILFSILLDGDASLSESMFKWTSFVIPRFSWKGIIKKDYAVFVSFYTQHKVPLAFAYPRPTVKTLLDYSSQCFPQNK